MPDHTKLFTEELFFIADALVRSAGRTREGTCWQTLHREPHGPLHLRSLEAIYNGNAGILLFFISLYRYTRRQEHLEIARSGLTYLLHLAERPETVYRTFYTGATGIIYVCLEMYDVTGERPYLDEAERLTSQWQHDMLKKVALHDLISGHAGNLLVAAQLYCHTGKQEHHHLMQQLLEEIIAGARLSRTGLKWGYKTNALDSFTGMSHGACGIGHVLLELYAVSGDPQLRWMGEKAFQYENEYFSRELQSWVDLRIFPEHRDHENILEKGVPLYFAKRAEVNTWAHGLAGMGLARLHAYRHTGNRRYLKESRICLRQTLNQLNGPMSNNYTLSTGYGAWIALFLEAHRYFPRDNYLAHADSLLLRAIGSRKAQGYYASAWYLNRSDPALMVGYAGIGQLLLHRLHPVGTTSVLAPGIKAPRPPVFHFEVSPRPAILRRYFGKTLHLLALNGISTEQACARPGTGKQEWPAFMKELAALIASQAPDTRHMIEDVFRIEKKILQLGTDPAITLYREVRSDTFSRMAAATEGWDAAQLAGGLFSLSRHVLLLASDWYGAVETTSGALPEQQRHYFLIRQDADGARHFPLNRFGYLLLRQLKKGKSLAQLVEKVQAVAAVNDQQVIREKVVTQLKAFIRQWFIEVSGVR